MDSGAIVVLPDRFRDPNYFEDVIDLKEGIFARAKALDCSRISFIEPYSMISLILLGKACLRSRGERLKLVNIPIPVHQYLDRMDFFEGGVFMTDETLSEKMLYRRSAFSRSVIEITEIPNKERESIQVIRKVIALFRKRSTHILKYWMTPNIIEYFVTVISELCQNIYEHSMDSGYLAMQTYMMGKENIVRLVISDSGIGIRKSFEQRQDIRYGSVAELIEKSITLPISSKREFGYGLCQVNSIVKMLKGIIFIRSENAYVTSLYHKKMQDSAVMFLKNDLSSFNGTQISITLSS
ncbi:MAG: sensor histidine kinase [Spirochaetes bacterium]|nr:sensor histidine kinase [Spirochaetota bacterium]